MFKLSSLLASAAVTVALVLPAGPALGEPDDAPGSETFRTLALATPDALARNTGFTSDNVEWLGVIPRHAGSSGGTLKGKHYYMTDPRGVFIYDVSKPAEPELVGELPAVQSTTHAVFAQEEPETNGKILLVNAFSQGADGAPSPDGWLLVVDVKDKSAPKVLSSLNVYDHTWSCFLGCKYAIGRSGHILDLRNPKQPKQIANWREKVFQPGYMHDFIEVAPGRLIGSGQPSLYLDLRNPKKPRELARIDPQFHSLGYHGAVWPRKAKDALMLLGAEVAPQGMSNAGSDCADDSVHAVATYDASAVAKVDKKEFGSKGSRSTAVERARAKAKFRKLQEWRVEGRGAYADGKAPGHTLYCGHWFDPHPKWRNGGVLTIAHYDWGTRFLDVKRNGSMKEIGWFQPVAGHTASAKWITKQIVYVHDYRRGLEILRFSR